MIDLDSEGKSVTAEHLQTMDNLKTGALMAAGCKLGCISAGASEKQLDAAAGVGGSPPSAGHAGVWHRCLRA